MVVGGYDKIIYDVIANVPGAMHDATAYRLSEFKAYLESRYPREICVGDKAYPISDVMIKPYEGRDGEWQSQGTVQHASLWSKDEDDRKYLQYV